MAIESEILWNLNESSKIYLKFYFPVYANFKKDQKYSSIAFSQFELDISNIIDELPLKNSYDYLLDFYQPLPQGAEKDAVEGVCVSERHHIPAFKKNMIPARRNPDRVPLITRSWFNEALKEEHSYIRPIS